MAGSYEHSITPVNFIERVECECVKYWLLNKDPLMELAT